MFFFRISDLEATEFFILENYVCFQSLKYSIKFTYKCTYRVQNRSCFFEKKKYFYCSSIKHLTILEVYICRRNTGNISRIL